MGTAGPSNEKYDGGTTVRGKQIRTALSPVTAYPPVAAPSGPQAAPDLFRSLDGMCSVDGSTFRVSLGVSCATRPLQLGVTNPCSLRHSCLRVDSKCPGAGADGKQFLMERGTPKQPCRSTRFCDGARVDWLLRTIAVVAVYTRSTSRLCVSGCGVSGQLVRREEGCGFGVDSRVTTGESAMYWDDYSDARDVEALWTHPGVKAEWTRAGQEPGHKVRVSRNSAGQHFVTEVEMRALADITITRHFGGSGLDPVMICAIADVESNRLPLAYRYEVSVKEASTGLMQTLQSTAEWLANDMGYRAYGFNQSLQSLYRPFVSVYFGAAYLKWLSTYGGKRRDQEFIVRGYNGGPKGAISQYTLGYWNKYSVAKRHWTCGVLTPTVKCEIPMVLKPSSLAPNKDNPTSSSTAAGPEWMYWDEKTSNDDMEELWTHEEVRLEWEQAGERRGKVRFSRDKRLQPYLTQAELKAVASIIIRRHFHNEGVKPDMLCRLSEVSSNRQLYGSGSRGGIMQMTASTAQWLYRDMGYRFYRIECEEDLSQPFVCMYFGAAYVSWLSKYQGRDRNDEFVVRAYHGGPQAANKPDTQSFWLKFLGSEAVN